MFPSFGGERRFFYFVHGNAGENSVLFARVVGRPNSGKNALLNFVVRIHRLFLRAFYGKGPFAFHYNLYCLLVVGLHSDLTLFRV